jgi:hypothetical protein
MNNLHLDMLRVMPELATIISDSIIASGEWKTADKRERAKALKFAITRLTPTPFSIHQLEAFIDEIDRRTAAEKQAIRNGLYQGLMQKTASCWMQIVSRMPDIAGAPRKAEKDLAA